jgi:hypothetical protein
MLKQKNLITNIDNDKNELDLFIALFITVIKGVCIFSKKLKSRYTKWQINFKTIIISKILSISLHQTINELPPVQLRKQLHVAAKQARIQLSLQEQRLLQQKYPLLLNSDYPNDDQGYNEIEFMLEN